GEGVFGYRLSFRKGSSVGHASGQHRDNGGASTLRFGPRTVLKCARDSFIRQDLRDLSGRVGGVKPAMTLSRRTLYLARMQPPSSWRHSVRVSLTRWPGSRNVGIPVPSRIG